MVEVNFFVVYGTTKLDRSIAYKIFQTACGCGLEKNLF